DALLSGATTKKEVKSETSDLLKKEGDLDTADTIASVPDIAEAASVESEVKAEFKQDQDAPVVFKKRKSKR
ncbi:hypothetical protein KCU60_g17356, partial [Aureobasidium melanogenum]